MAIWDDDDHVLDYLLLEEEEEEEKDLHSYSLTHYCSLSSSSGHATTTSCCRNTFTDSFQQTTKRKIEYKAMQTFFFSFLTSSD